MPNPLFSTYTQSENRVTATILAVFERLSFALVERLIQLLCQEPETTLLTFRNQPPGIGSTPDGLIRASFAYWLETKRVAGAVKLAQIKNHLKALETVGTERQRLLVLTPDLEIPPGLAELNDERVAWANFDDLISAVQEIIEPGADWLSSD